MPHRWFGALVRPLAVAALVAATAPAAHASRAAAESDSWKITFRSGRTMEAAAWQVSGGFLTLTLHGGGEVSVPMTTVHRTERVEGPAGSSRSAAGLALEPLELLPGDRCDPTSDDRVTRWDEIVARTAPRFDLDPDLVSSVIAAESCGIPDAVSRAGAIGLMQLMPATALDYGVADPFDPVLNVEAGCRHLARLRAKLGDDLDLLLAAYNAGEGTVERHGGVPSYPETIDYVRRVKGWMQLVQADTDRDPIDPGSRRLVSTLGG